MRVIELRFFSPNTKVKYHSVFWTIKINSSVPKQFSYIEIIIYISLFLNYILKLLTGIEMGALTADVHFTTQCQRLIQIKIPVFWVKVQCSVTHSIQIWTFLFIYFFLCRKTTARNHLSPCRAHALRKSKDLVPSATLPMSLRCSTNRRYRNSRWDNFNIKEYTCRGIQG